jgi:hypothetical protein
MPVEWKPAMSIAEFIAYRQKHPKQKGARRRTVFHKTTDAEIIKTVSFQAPNGVHDPVSRGLKRKDDIHPAEGTLEIQHSLLLHVARLENLAKEFSAEGPQALQPRSRCYVTEAEQAKRELFRALYMMWNSKR